MAATVHVPCGLTRRTTDTRNGPVSHLVSGMLSTVQTCSVSRGINKQVEEKWRGTHTSWLARAEQRGMIGGDETPMLYAYHLDLWEVGNGEGEKCTKLGSILRVH